MTEKIQAVRGMNDILPEDAPYWQWVELVCREVAAQYAYRECRFPIIEQTRLFQRSIGTDTDIVEKEMYTFEDRNGDSLTLRPEGTAGCVRAGIEHGLLYNQIQRLWYLGSMFRHERPQQGRYRQFQQFGVEAFGLSGPDVDVEIILLSRRLWACLGLSDQIVLELNTLGTLEQRRVYRDQLITYFKAHASRLDADSQRRLQTNPLRILDSKNPELQSVIAEAPNLMDCIDGEAKAHFEELCALLDAASVTYRINPHLVRGLDYYGLTVFEWVTDRLGAQSAVCAGGRYDNLVSQLGGKATPAVGFAMGLERIVLLLQAQQSLAFVPNFYVIAMDAVYSQALLFTEQLRTRFPAYSIEMHAGGGNFKNQFKRADKSGASFALVFGESEVKSNTVTVKDLRGDGEQKTVSHEQLFAFITAL